MEIHIHRHGECYSDWFPFSLSASFSICRRETNQFSISNFFLDLTSDDLICLFQLSFRSPVVFPIMLCTFSPLKRFSLEVCAFDIDYGKWSRSRAVISLCLWPYLLPCFVHGDGATPLHRHGHQFCLAKILDLFTTFWYRSDWVLGFLSSSLRM